MPAKPSGKRIPPRAAVLGPAFAVLLQAGAAEAQRGSEALLDLSLEQLGDVVVTSVSRRSERVADAPASIYVIDQDQIRRAGARSLPEALRLAPNLQVARVDAAGYAISARGFNNSLGNKLLVLIDGRTIYTPLFSGVFWDAQDVLLEDVERIEVISGPGATLWGANAVNGVINVITRQAQGGDGGLLAAEAGGDRRSARLRVAGALGENGGYRVYAQHASLEASEDAQGRAQLDGWERRLAGLRADWQHGERSWGVRAEHLRGESDANVFGPTEVSGTQLTAVWQQREEDGALRMQAYYDRSERHDPVLFHDRMEIFDIEATRQRRLGRHGLVWGAGHRRAQDRVEAGVLTTFLPGRRRLQWSNAFVQDEIELDPALRLTLGLKLDRNTYTGVEWLPSARLAWTPTAHRLVWGALSRAVRAPSRIDREFFLPAAPPYLIAGGPRFESEIADVLELGYRAQGAAWSWSTTLFHHRYDRLRSGEPVGGGSFQVRNGTAGRVSGLETWGEWRIHERWRLAFGWSAVHDRFHTKPGFNDPDGAVDLGNDPAHFWSLRSSIALTPTLDLQLAARRVGALPEPPIASYTVFDAGLLWRASPSLDVGLFARDLGRSSHAEFAPGPLAQTSVYEPQAWARIAWRW
jgi:iron complex outermembrane receptor protein